MSDRRIIDEPVVREQIQILRRILQQNIIEDENGIAVENDRKKKPPDLMVSPVDPDARYGAKSVSKKFTGYKANITQEVKSQIITNIEPSRGNRRDGEPTVDLVKSQTAIGLLPSKLIGDSAYGDGVWREALDKHGTKLVAPYKAKTPRTLAVFPKSAFTINRAYNTLKCPAGAVAKPHFYETQKNSYSFHFPQSACGKCKLKPLCTNAREGRRTVRIFDWQEATCESERYNRTDEFKHDMKLRQPIEGKFSEMKRYHGLTRAKYRGLKKVGLQFYFTAAAVNVKRWLHLSFDGAWANAAA
ncbi:MAG: transposase [Bdellovibrionales bacterium]|nr:transposase [Bdellovibrionales bacterium]